MEKKEKTKVFTWFDTDITELDRRASRHRRNIEKVDKMAEWEDTGGEGARKPVGTCWVHCRLWNTLPSL